MKGTNRAAENGTTKFSQNVCTTLVVGDHDHWAKVLQLHLPIQGLFEPGVPHQDEAAGREIVVMDLRCVLPGEAVHVSKTGGVDSLV